MPSICCSAAICAALPGIVRRMPSICCSHLRFYLADLELATELALLVVFAATWVGFLFFFGRGFLTTMFFNSNLAFLQAMRASTSFSSISHSFNPTGPAWGPHGQHMVPRWAIIYIYIYIYIYIFVALWAHPLNCMYVYVYIVFYIADYNDTWLNTNKLS
jgi:hypothetical protein